MNGRSDVYLATSRLQQTLTTSTLQIDGEESPSSEYPAERKRRRVKRKKRPSEYVEAASFDIPGVNKIAISPECQKTVECIVGHHVTSENPWIYVSKEAIEDNLEYHEDSSEFLPIKNEILAFRRPQLLIGYIPDEQRDYDEFYICLTEGAEDAVSEIIKRLQNAQQERLYNSINKLVKPWKSLGSEIEVNRMLNLPNRPLLEVEVETDYPIMKNKSKFKLRLVEHARDGYTEILSTRKTFKNIIKARITSEIQVTPTYISQEAQTTYTYPRNAWTQYEYEYEPITTLSKDFTKNLHSFAGKELDALSDMMTVNSNINLYSDDYADLVKDQRYTHVPDVSVVKEYASFIEENVGKGKGIASVSWHPMWTGTVAIAYSSEVSCNYRNTAPIEDEVNAALYDVAPVLIWSFKDTLSPRLYLETPRAVQVVSWCPYDENILVGGCLNGQIIVWDIKDKLKHVETEEILTQEQLKNRQHLFKFMRWMKNTKDLKLVRYTAISEIEYSHKRGVTGMLWSSPFREMTKTGKIVDIPEESNRIALQFMTCSKDGSILSWDLLAKSLYYNPFRPQRKLRRLTHRPPALITDVSPLRDLNGCFKPVFKINVFEPKTNRPLSIASFTLRKTPPLYEEVNPDPHRKFNIADRIEYRPLFNKPTHPLFNKLVMGSCEGDFVVGTWEGYEYNAGEVVNKENAKIECIARYHDGPITSVSRSDQFPTLIITTGGKVFCIWMAGIKCKPVMWRRSKHRYTQGVWNSHRPSMFRLTRADGCMEMWHLKTRSDRYQSLTQVSGRGVTGTYSHKIAMKQNILGCADSAGALRLFYISHNLMQLTEEDKYSTFRFCEREIKRKQHFIKWQEDWLTKNAEFLKQKKEQELLAIQEKEAIAKMEKERLLLEKEQAAKEIEIIAIQSKPQPGLYSQWAQEQWMTKEKDRMRKVLLSKKHIVEENLDRDQLPLQEAEKEERRKTLKQQKRLDKAEDIFVETVNMMFPEAVREKPPPPQDLYAGGETVEVKLDYFNKYRAVETKCEEFIKAHPYDPHFNWFAVVRAGKERRRLLDRNNAKYNHANRLVRERKQKQDLLAEAALPPKPAVQTVVESTSEYTLIAEENLES